MPKLVRRDDRDPSQRIRLAVQLAFLALNVFVGIRFMRWVRSFDQATEVARPAGVEGWLPIAGLMNLKAWIATGVVPQIHPAAMFLLIAFLLIALLLKKAFCSWLCPIGTISEFLWKLGRRFGSNAALPKWLDVPLRGLKYALLAFFVWAIVKMPAESIDAFMRSPYGVVADVKLLNFFRFMSATALSVVAVLIALSVIVKNFWCRYLCPYGALLAIPSLLSPVRIRRDAEKCIDCAKCAKACPARLPVDRKPQIRSAECTLCMNCVAVCPAKGALRTLSPWTVAVTIAVIFFGVVIAARATGHWDTDLPREVYAYFISLTH